MCAAYCQLHPRGVHLSQHCSRSPQLLPLQRVASRSTRRHVPLNNWKVWGPTAEYSDGDAEFFSVTNRLTDQYEWFAPKQDVQEPEPSEQVEEDKPPYGLTPKEIAALGLSGPRTNIPDSVSNGTLLHHPSTVSLLPCTCWPVKAQGCTVDSRALPHATSHQYITTTRDCILPLLWSDQAR